MHFLSCKSVWSESRLVMTVRPADLDKYLQLKVLAIECICYEYTYA